MVGVCFTEGGPCCYWEVQSFSSSCCGLEKYGLTVHYALCYTILQREFSNACSRWKLKWLADCLFYLSMLCRYSIWLYFLQCFSFLVFVTTFLLLFSAVMKKKLIFWPDGAWRSGWSPSSSLCSLAQLSHIAQDCPWKRKKSWKPGKGKTCSDVYNFRTF